MSCGPPAAMLDEDEEDRVDESALQQLTEMGFPESRAVKALRLTQWVSLCLTYDSDEQWDERRKPLMHFFRV